MSGVIELAVLALCWLVLTVGMLLLYLLVVGPGLENLRDALFKAIRSNASYEEMHETDIALGITGMFLVVGAAPLIIMAYSGLFEWAP